MAASTTGHAAVGALAAVAVPSARAGQHWFWQPETNMPATAADSDQLFDAESDDVANMRTWSLITTG
jgi:hypothetical protein